MKIQKGEFEIFFKAHAIFRAVERGIPWEFVEKTVHGGKFFEFGKNMMKIRKEFSAGRSF